MMPDRYETDEHAHAQRHEVDEALCGGANLDRRLLVHVDLSVTKKKS